MEKKENLQHYRYRLEKMGTGVIVFINWGSFIRLDSSQILVLLILFIFTTIHFIFCFKICFFVFFCIFSFSFSFED